MKMRAFLKNQRFSTFLSTEKTKINICQQKTRKKTTNFFTHHIITLISSEAFKMQKYFVSVFDFVNKINKKNEKNDSAFYAEMRANRS
jgi:hypothetical protein